MRNTLKDGFNQNKQINSKKCLNDSLISYNDKKNIKGRNDNISKLGEFIKDNPSNFFKTTYVTLNKCGVHIKNGLI